MMKAINQIILTVIVCLPIGLTAQDLSGTWKMSMPDENGNMVTVQSTISDDGTYALDWGADGSVEIKGKYTSENGQITFWDTSGSQCTAKGVYKWKVEGNTLTMTRVSDGCDGRGGPEGVMTWQRG